MGWLQRSEETATRTDPLASWGERAWKAVLWIFGPSTLLGAAVTVWGWLTHNPQYGLIIGLITFTIVQAGLTFNAIRKSRAQTGPMAQLAADTDSHQIPAHMIAERHIRYHETPIRLVDLLEAVGDNGVLRDFQFEHCTLEGPGIINVEGPFPKPETTTSDSGSFGRASLSLGPTHCRVEGSPDTTLYQVTHDSKPPVGTIHLSGYTLQSVTFKGLGFAGTPEHLERLKEQLIFSEGNDKSGA